MTVSALFLAEVAAPSPAHLDFSPRPGTLPVADCEARIARFASTNHLSDVVLPSLRCAVLLWHDHQAAAHAICQDQDDLEGALLHAILHRREGDFGNAKYWFDQVPDHPIYHPLMIAARSLDLKLEAVVGRFSPAAFVDAVAAYVGPPARGRTVDHGQWRDDLVRLQQAEYELFVTHLLVPRR